MTYLIPTKIVHAAHDWQPHKVIFEGNVDKCVRCGALRATKCGYTIYTVPECDVDQTNKWYRQEQPCAIWEARQAPRR